LRRPSPWSMAIMAGSKPGSPLAGYPVLTEGGCGWLRLHRTGLSQSYLLPVSRRPVHPISLRPFCDVALTVDTKSPPTNHRALASATAASFASTLNAFVATLKTPRKLQKIGNDKRTNGRAGPHTFHHRALRLRSAGRAQSRSP
jgi:hypothetical protein